MMRVEVVYVPVLKTPHEEIRVRDIIRIEHKDGRPLQGRLTDINGEMLYVDQPGGTEVVHKGMIETIYKCNLGG